MKLSLLLAGLPFVMAIEPVNIPLYAYGPGKIGGFAVVNIDGYAYISGSSADQLNSSVSEANFTSSDNSLMVNTNNETLFLQVSTESGEIRFGNNSANASLITTGFGWYGKTLFINVDNIMETLWYAKSAGTNLYQLVWNDTTAMPVTVRNSAPSHALD